MATMVIISGSTNLRSHSQTPQMVLNNTVGQSGSNSPDSIEEFDSISDEQHESSTPNRTTIRSRRNSSTQRVVPPPSVSRVSNILYGIKKRGGYSLDRNNNALTPRSSAATRRGRVSNAHEHNELPIFGNNNSNSNEKIISSSGSVKRLISRSAFYKLYEIGRLIGQGNFSEVFMVYSEKNGKKYAVKEIDKNRMTGKLHFIENEIAILKQCENQRNICCLIDAYECVSLYLLVFEYAQKGDLFETIKRMGRLSERSAAQITYQTSSALHFLHSRKIVHRDVKPENILLGADFCVKLTDFGLACQVLGPLYRVCGTPTYVAPEVLTQQGYELEVDIWSLGILLYIMLSGFAPFRSADRVQLFKLIMKANISFDMPIWNKVSTKAKNLVLNLLTSNVSKRYKAIEVLSDDWIRLFNHITN